jgi:hypothetical protein
MNKLAKIYTIADLVSMSVQAGIQSLYEKPGFLLTRESYRKQNKFCDCLSKFALSVSLNMMQHFSTLHYCVATMNSTGCESFISILFSLFTSANC